MKEEAGLLSSQVITMKKWTPSALEVGQVALNIFLMASFSSSLNFLSSGSSITDFPILCQKTYSCPRFSCLFSCQVSSTLLPEYAVLEHKCYRACNIHSPHLHSYYLKPRLFMSCLLYFGIILCFHQCSEV